MSFARTIWSLITANATTALEAGTLVERPDHHLTRVPLRVDEQGWSEMTDAYMELYERVYEIQADSAERLGEAPDDPGISVLSVLAFFETPESAPRHQAHRGPAAFLIASSNAPTDSGVLRSSRPSEPGPSIANDGVPPNPSFSAWWVVVSTCFL